MKLCSARRQNGTACKAYAIVGGRVCRMHGGAAPQVVNAAKRRLALAADDVVRRLVGICLSKRTKDADVIAAARDLLDRASVRPERDAASNAGDGTVLWEEFIQIYRRKVLDTQTINE
jgi:hypothetical protein